MLINGSLQKLNSTAIRKCFHYFAGAHRNSPWTNLTWQFVPGHTSRR